MKTCNSGNRQPMNPAQSATNSAPLLLERVDPLDLRAQRETLAFVDAYMNSASNHNGALLPRPAEQYKEAFAWGNVVRGRRGQDTVFCAMTYLYRGPQGLYVEVGAVLNTDPQRGLMEPVVRALVARTFRTWPDASVFAVASPRTASAHVLNKVGMRPVDPPADLRLLRAEAGVPFSDRKAVFLMRF